MHTALVACCALAASILVFTGTVKLFGARTSLKRRLADLEGRSPDHSLAAVGRLLDQKERGQLQRRLTEAGWYDVTPVRMAVRALLSAVGGAVLAIVLVFAGGLAQPASIVAVLLVTAAAAVLPSLQLDGAIKARKAQIARELPDLLDMVATTVEAGVALNGALANGVAILAGPLRRELEMALADMRMGLPRAEALTAMAGRVRQEDLSSVVTALVQSEKLGSNIARVLESLAEEARERRLMRVEELAAQLPIKMTIPMAICLLPALFVIIFAPVVADFVAR